MRATMLDRYANQSVEALWSLESVYGGWLYVEHAFGLALEREHIIDKGQADAAFYACWPIDSQAATEITALEEITKHDVVAFLRWVEKTCAARGVVCKWLHYGLTSSDIVDTALAVRLHRSLLLVREALSNVCGVLESLARKHAKDCYTARTHGMDAHATTFGWVLCSHLAEFDRLANDWADLDVAIRHGKLSGPVGTYPHSTQSAERWALDRLGLKPEPVGTQIIPRDRHCRVMQFLSLVAVAVERLSVRLRLLHQSSVAEISEKRTDGQTGSSSMPHKHNPISAETLCGLSRLVRGYEQPVLESAATWFERDISHSSVERVALRDSLSLTVTMLSRLATLLAGLWVDTERMFLHMLCVPDSQSEMLNNLANGVPRANASASATSTQKKLSKRDANRAAMLVVAFLQERTHE